MNFIYVLSSSETDYYYEQFFLSSASLRLYNPEAHIIVLVDPKTKQNLISKRTAYEKIVSEIKVIDVPCELSQKEASRWIKTSIHHYVSGGFLFIDCDTIVTQKLENSFPLDIHIGAVLDTHVTLDKHHLSKNFQKEDISTHFVSSLKTNTRFNGGLILYIDHPQANNFFEKWHSLWLQGLKKGCSQDMPSLNQANYELNNIITELNGEWNCQISHNGLPYLSKAKIIHYYATSLVSLDPAFKLASQEVFAIIKENDKLSPEIEFLLENPKTAFEPCSRIISDKETIDAFDNSLFFKFLRYNKRNPGLLKKIKAFKASLK